MKQTLQDIQVKCDDPILILCENTITIIISKNPMICSKINHIPIKYHFLQEKDIEKKIKLEYVRTKDKIANILTKPLARETFEYL
jgi:hypothetical protein